MGGTQLTEIYMNYMQSAYLIKTYVKYMEGT